MNTHALAKNLIKLRQSKNWTQDDMSEKLHISRQAISKWETGASVPNLDILLKLSKLYNISINEILEPSTPNKINNFEEIIDVDSEKLKSILTSFSISDIVKASMGASPSVNELLRNLFGNIDFKKEKTAIGSIKIAEIEDIHNYIVGKINSQLSQSIDPFDSESSK